MYFFFFTSVSRYTAMQMCVTLQELLLLTEVNTYVAMCIRNTGLQQNVVNDIITM